MLTCALRAPFRYEVTSQSIGGALMPMTLETILLGSIVAVVAIFLVAVLVVKRWVPQAAGLFLLLAPLNYFYVLVFGWQVSWGYAGTISEGAPALVKYAKDIVFLVIIFVWLLTLLSRKPNRRVRYHILDLLVGLFVGYQIIMVIPAIAEIGLVPSLTALWLNSGYALMYFMMRSVLSRCSIRQLKVWASRMLLLGGAIALIGFWQVFFGPSISNYTVGSFQNVTRAYATMGSPNNLGMYLCILLLMSLMWGLYQKSTLRLASTLLVTGCLLLTVSVSSVFGAALIVGLYLVKGRNWKRLLFVVGLVVAAMIFVTLLVPAVWIRVVNSLTGGEASWLLRVDNWRQLWPTDFWKIIFGAGGGVAGVTISFSGVNLLADNQYLAILLQFGIVGVVMYGALLVAGGNLALRESLKIGVPYSTTSKIVGGLIVVLFVIWGVVANVLNSFPMNAYFWCALAMVASAPRKEVSTSA